MRVRASLGVAFVLLMAAPALATTVLRFSTQELTERADVILHGTCTAVTGRTTPEGVVTDVELRVTRGLKNHSAATFSFSTYGGVTSERGTFIAGAPNFQVGEEVVVFLDRANRQGHRLAIGMSQGKYTVREEAGRKLATRNLVGLRFVDPATGEVEEAGQEQAVVLDDLLAAVEQHLGKR
jgi:hypothetical protein